jgi:hypothetical protein
MSTPEAMPGKEKDARVKVQMAMKMLQQQFPNFDIGTDQFKALQSAIKTLSTAFGESEDRDRDLIPAEIRQMLSSIGPGSASPGQAAMMGGGAPPGGPGPAAP